MLPKLKLWQKGLALVSVLLCFELAVIGVLWLMLERAQQEADRGMHAQEIIRAGNQLVQACYESGKNLGWYLGLHQRNAGEAFDREVAKIDPTFAKLEDVCRQDPGALEALQPLKQSLARTKQEMIESKEAVESGEKWSAGVFRKKLLSDVKDTVEQVKALISENQEVSEVSGPQKAAELRTAMKRALLISVALNVVLAISMALFFMRDIVEGLNRLADNSFRLARGQSLLPAATGGDEIAQLDRVFHDMAHALTEAAAKEKAALDRTKSIIASMPVGLVTIDSNGIMHSVNPRTQQMFGYEENALVGRHFCSLFSPAQATDPQQFFQELKAKALNKVSESKAKKADGSMFPVEVSLDEVSLGTDETFLANILDITERYEIERMKREFVAMVSHDLRTPLTSIEASLTLLAAGAFGTLPDNAVETVTVAEGEVGRLRSLVNDLLDIAKIEAGKMDMHFDEVEIGYVIDRAILAVDALADKHNVDIKFAESNVTGYGDSDRLIQVMVNLLSNAVKYSPDGGEITVSASTAGEFVEVRVRDQGPGVPEEYREAIFHKFEQVKGANQKSGTGLGLAICRTIVDQHGGAIGVDAAEPNGSIFWFRIPKQPEQQTKLSLAPEIAVNL